MKKTINTSPSQEAFLKAYSSQYTCRELATELNLTMQDVYNYCGRKHLALRKQGNKKTRRNLVRLPKYTGGYAPAPSIKPMNRPLAVYTNKTPYGIANHF